MRSKQRELNVQNVPLEAGNPIISS